MNKSILLLNLILTIVGNGFAQIPPASEVRQSIADAVASIKSTPLPVQEVSTTWAVEGTDSVRIRIYRPQPTADLPIIYFIHGGGFIAGDLETHDNACRYMAHHLQSIVIAVDYRRPPEHKFPIAFDESKLVLNWITGHQKQLGGNGKLFLMGDSAGGQLVAALCVQNASLEKPVPITAQVLINPVTDMRKVSVSYKTFYYFADWYLNQTDDPNDLRISPLLSTNYNKLPAALVVVGEKDAIRSDGELYHENLTKAGVKSSLYVQPKAGHLGPAFCAAHAAALPAMEWIVQQMTPMVR